MTQLILAFAAGWFASGLLTVIILYRYRHRWV